MTATETIYSLTKNDVKALRTADRVCFDHFTVQKPNSGRQSGIRCIKVGSAPWREEVTFYVNAKSSVYLHGDGIDYDVRNGKTATCFDMIHSPQCSEEWKTIVSLLREGDEIELRWMGCDQNGYLNRATVTDSDNDGSAGLGMKLCHDKLYLHVRRGGKRKYSFYLSDSVCPDNSARMIRPYGGA